MRSIFAETMAKAISTYREILRKYMRLQQPQRSIKLKTLNLKNPAIYKSDLALYEVAHNIIKDIETNFEVDEKGYYSYSGIQKFCDYLKDYLSKYHVEDGEVVHRAQKASKAMLNAIQLITLPKERLDQSIESQLMASNEVIAAFGSKEQHNMHMQHLERLRETNQPFYETITENFKQQLKQYKIDLYQHIKTDNSTQNISDADIIEENIT